MAAARTTDRPQDFTDLQIDIEKFKYQIETMVKQGDRQERKIDEMKVTLDALSFPSRHEFDDYKDANNARFQAIDKEFQLLDDRFVTLKSTKALRAIFLAVGIALATAIVLALARLLGTNL